MPDILYYGYWRDGDGHGLYTEHKQSVRLRGELEWMRVADGFLAPQDVAQMEGAAALSYIHGYTVVSFWDRSGDSRGNSVSTFFIPGHLSFDRALKTARIKFPELFERFTFEIKGVGMSRVAIVCGFPGVGKTHCCNQQEVPGVFDDSDSSQFSWLAIGKRNPRFPQNYIQHIKRFRYHFKFMFVSTHKVVLDALVAEGLPFILVYPEAGLKEEYLQRFRDRNSDEAFIQTLDNNWDNFMQDLDSQDCCSTVRLKTGEYLSDVLDVLAAIREANA